MNGLRRQSQVTHDGDSGADDGRHSRQAFSPTLQFDRLHSALLQEAARVAHGLLHAYLIGQEGHVADAQCPARLAAHVSQRLSIPTIGIGAGVGCDGQVLVTHDLLGMFPRFTPRFVRQYADLHAEMVKAFSSIVTGSVFS
ncbi:MAG: hypothetical protein A2Y93_16365 [Chloroflexi bacterium RBG_13_68_17]|nr:MAG: hypothetical protein A2Y93_16365 [Chloroflexi bacterium RBG_13_68_17]